MSKINYVNVADLNKLLLKKLSILPRKFDLIVGLPASGLIPANLLSLYLNRPFSDLNSFLNGHIYKAGERGSFFSTGDLKRVLIIDDCLRSGDTLKNAREKLKTLNDQFEFSFCVVYLQAGKESDVDYFFETTDQPQFYQWNLLRDGIREKVQFNMHKTPVYAELSEYPFLISPGTIQAEATFKKTGRPVLALDSFDIISSTDTMWKDLKSGKYLPGVKQFAVQTRNQLRSIRKKINL